MTSTLMARSDARRRGEASVWKGNQSFVAVDGFRGEDGGLAAMEHGSWFRHIGIAGAQIAGLNLKLACEQIFGMLGGEPASFFGDADGNDFVFLFINGVENGGGGEQGDFVLSAAAAE